MTRGMRRAAAAGLMAAALAMAAGAAPVKVIFDTDVGNDVDDALALAILHALADRGECELLAVTITKGEPGSAAYADLVNTFYGRPDVPIGFVCNGVTPDPSFATKIASMTNADGSATFPHDVKDGRGAPEAAALLRRVLAKQPDGSVVIVQVGFSSNLARLLDSGPDEASPLAGPELVRRKVRLLQVMAGRFDRSPEAEKFAEWNVKKDIPAAKRVFADWPTPIEASGWEIGHAVLIPARCIERDFAWSERNPVREAFFHYGKWPYDRPAWDLTSVLQAVRPESGYFGLSEPGRIEVDDAGHAALRPDPQGTRRFFTMTPEQAIRVREALMLLSTQPPAKRE